MKLLILRLESESESKCWTFAWMTNTQFGYKKWRRRRGGAWVKIINLQNREFVIKKSF